MAIIPRPVIFLISLLNFKPQKSGIEKLFLISMRKKVYTIGKS
jgi:hypothetical protein